MGGYLAIDALLSGGGGSGGGGGGDEVDGCLRYRNNDSSCVPFGPLPPQAPCGDITYSDYACQSGLCRRGTLTERVCCYANGDGDSQKCLNQQEGDSCHGFDHTDQCAGDLICNDTNV